MKWSSTFAVLSLAIALVPSIRANAETPLAAHSPSQFWAQPPAPTVVGPGARVGLLSQRLLNTPLTLAPGYVDNGRNDCVAAAVTMVLRYFEATLPSAEARRITTDYPTVIRALRNFPLPPETENLSFNRDTPDAGIGMQNEVALEVPILSGNTLYDDPESWTVDTWQKNLLAELHEGRPVIAYTQLLPGGHAIVVVGMDRNGQRIYYNDPWTGSLKDISAADLQAAWQGLDFSVQLIKPEGSAHAGQNGSSPTPGNTMPRGGSLRSVACTGSNTCVAVGENGISLISTDGGGNWRNGSANGNRLLTSVTCPTSNGCLTVGAGGTVLHSTDGGTRWTSHVSGNTQILAGISCPSSTDCLVVGDDGTLLATENGGTTWHDRSSGVDNQLYGVACPSSNTCIAVGDTGTILKTADGGRTWHGQTLNSGAELYGITCPTHTRCLAVGGIWDTRRRSLTGTIVSSTDSGNTWLAVRAGPWPDLHGIACQTRSDCIAVGDRGTILNSADGGATWHSQPSGVTWGLAAVACPTRTTCIVVGADSGILVSTDGGLSWSNHFRHG